MELNINWLFPYVLIVITSLIVSFLLYLLTLIARFGSDLHEYTEIFIISTLFIFCVVLCLCINGDIIIK